MCLLTAATKLVLDVGMFQDQQAEQSAELLAEQANGDTTKSLGTAKSLSSQKVDDVAVSTKCGDTRRGKTRGCSVLVGGATSNAQSATVNGLTNHANTGAATSSDPARQLNEQQQGSKAKAGKAKLQQSCTGTTGATRSTRARCQTVQAVRTGVPAAM